MSICITYGSGAVAIPEKALDCNAGLIELRVLMILCQYADLREAYPDRIEELARLTGCQVSAVREAISFWNGTGILATTVAEPPAKRTVKADRALIRDTIPDYSGEELAALVEDEEGKLRHLIDSFQNILGKMLSRTEIEKLAALSDYLRLENEYLLLLAQHCVRQNKKSMAYIVRTAYGLFNDGIDDYPKLDAHIRHREKYQSVIGRIRRMLGIGERELTKKENAYINQWIEEFAMPIEVIERAYQITIDSIKELSFDYMGKILENWHSAGATTIPAVEELLEAHRRQRAEAAEKSAEPDSFSSFNTDDFFEAAIKRSWEAL